MSQLQYKFYATLLDSFESYLSSTEIYQQFWGFSENPKLTEEEFEKEQFQNLIDKINRVPFESEPASKGTAFNEVVDCIIEDRTSAEWEIKSDKESGKIFAKNDKYSFDFPLDLTVKIARRLEGALTQHFVEGVLSTKYGNVLLYGYIDQLLPFKVVDLKTTSRYNAFKYRNTWQRIVYPYCLAQNGVDIREFEYLATNFKDVFEEPYLYNPERDIPKLIDHCERFIEFLEMNKELITDKKVFSEELVTA